LRDSVTNALHHAGLREVNPRSHRPCRRCWQRRSAGVFASDSWER
jgi:hypothetical protein